MPDRYRRRNPAEIEARLLLIQQGWDVARSYGNDGPPDLLAMRKGEFLLLMIRHSRQPVPDAASVTLLYGEDLDRMRLFGTTDCLTSEAWVLAPPDGWQCYEILPGGIRRIWREGIAPAPEADAPEKVDAPVMEDAREPAVVYGESCVEGIAPAPEADAPEKVDAPVMEDAREPAGGYGESCGEGRVLAPAPEADAPERVDVPVLEDALGPAVVYGESCGEGRVLAPAPEADAPGKVDAPVMGDARGPAVVYRESCVGRRVLPLEEEVDQISLPWDGVSRQDTSSGRQEIKGYDCSAPVERVRGCVRRKEPEQAPDSPLFPAGRLQQDSPESGLILLGTCSSTTVEISQNGCPKKEGAVNFGPEPSPGLPQRVKVPETVPETPIPSQVTEYA